MAMVLGCSPLLQHRALATPLRSATVCPREFESLTEAMLRDLPDYTNRVLARSTPRSGLTLSEELGHTPERPLAIGSNIQTHVAIASQATYADAVPGIRWSSPSPEALAANGVQQVFFTTLERQYRGGGRRSISGHRLTRLQHYHWAIMTQAADGWRLVGLFSRLADYPASQPPSPFVDSTYGDVGHAIQLWLRDCRAGAIDRAADDPPDQGNALP